ncbi:hypothetical protein FS842_005013 [Serendipita sp. 407]|nr:hypothetical protein FS842_005013 [Serendipita sp. 407]
MDGVQQSGVVGLSDLFPILPIFSLVSFVCCMLVLPAFIKTRVFSLIIHVLWLALGNLLICINFCLWKNNTRNIPIYSDFVAHTWAMYSIIIYLNHLCFSKFVYNITSPGSSLKICDKRKKYNKLDVFLAVVLPILWTPVNLLALRGRYLIVEDIGPIYVSRVSLESTLIRSVPILLITAASVWFVVLALINVWRAQRISAMKRVTQLSHSHFYRDLTTTKVIKYLTMSTINLFGLMFGCIWAILPTIRILRKGDPWYTKFSIRDNIRQLPFIHTITRYQVGPNDTRDLKVFFFSIPVMGIVFFIFFGLGPEALARYRTWIQALSTFLQLSSLCNFLRTRAVRLGWLNAGVRPVDPEYFGPFEPSDITVDSHPIVIPQTLGRSPLQALPTRLTIDLPYYPTPLRAAQLDVHPSVPFSEEWRTYRKEPPITAFRLPNHHSPASPQFWSSPNGSSVTPGMRRVYRKELISSWISFQTSTSSSPHRLRLDLDSPSTLTRSDLWSTSYMTTDYSWPSPIERSTGYNESPPPYRPPIDRGVTSKDPLSALF